MVETMRALPLDGTSTRRVMPIVLVALIVVWPTATRTTSTAMVPMNGAAALNCGVEPDPPDQKYVRPSGVKQSVMTFESTLGVPVLSNVTMREMMFADVS